MARDLMEAKEELRRLRETRDENVRLLSDAKFSLMRSEHLQSSTISDCPVCHQTCTIQFALIENVSLYFDSKYT